MGFIWNFIKKSYKKKTKKCKQIKRVTHYQKKQHKMKWNNLKKIKWKPEKNEK